MFVAGIDEMVQADISIVEAVKSWRLTCHTAVFGKLFMNTELSQVFTRWVPKHLCNQQNPDRMAVSLTTFHCYRAKGDDLSPVMRYTCIPAAWR